MKEKTHISRRCCMKVIYAQSFYFTVAVYKQKNMPFLLFFPYIGTVSCQKEYIHTSL